MDNLQFRINTMKAAMIGIVNNSGLPGSICELVIENVLNQVKLLNVQQQESETEKEGDEQ